MCTCGGSACSRRQRKVATQHNDISFSVINEPDISAELDSSIRDTLVVCFPADREYYRNQSWWHCVPVYRVLARDREDFIVAHTAVVERVITCGQSAKVRVAGIQSFCVLPKYRGTGLSDELMSVAMQEAGRRGFDAGLLFCLPQLEPVYGRMGWSRLDAVVYMDDVQAGKTPIPTKNITMFYPLLAPAFRRGYLTTPFPAGDIDLAGTDW
jgi:GNAT superfamily N-acetyltransferase